VCVGCKMTNFFPFFPPAVVQVDGQPVRLQLCDTAGQVRPSMSQSHSTTVRCSLHHDAFHSFRS